MSSAEGCRVQEYKSRTLAHRTGSAFVQIQAEGGALSNLYDHALRASDTGTQAGGGQETGAVQCGTGFRDLRKAAAVGVPTTVPTVRIEAMISTEPKFSKKVMVGLGRVELPTNGLGTEGDYDAF
jgi:hypothetical protein